MGRKCLCRQSPVEGEDTNRSASLGLNQRRGKKDSFDDKR